MKKGHASFPNRSRNGRRTIARAAIDRMVKRIVKKFHPERVILFGSHASG
jgi:predicted nucleotidyltransferase